MKTPIISIRKPWSLPSEVWVTPIDNGVVTDVFGSRVNPVTGKSETHKGIDLGVPAGTEARAVKSGEVLDSGYSQSYGWWVKYATYDGYEILYAHLSKVVVQKGQKIKQKDVLAYTGSTGQATGPHLHYEVMHEGVYLDPYEYLS